MESQGLKYMIHNMLSKSLTTSPLYHFVYISFSYLTRLFSIIIVILIIHVKSTNSVCFSTQIYKYSDTSHPMLSPTHPISYPSSSFFFQFLQWHTLSSLDNHRLNIPLGKELNKQQIEKIKTRSFSRVYTKAVNNNQISKCQSCSCRLLRLTGICILKMCFPVLHPNEGRKRI